MNATECPFCNLPEEHVLARTDMAVAFYDRFPVSPGHVLVIPEDHIGSLLELPEKDLTELWSLVAYVRNLLKEKYQPAGFNIGINEGVAAGFITRVRCMLIRRMVSVWRAWDWPGV